MLVEIFTSTETSVNKNRLDSALKSTVTDTQIYNGKKLKDFGIELNFVCYTQGSWDAEKIVMGINLLCQENCFVISKFTITHKRENKLDEELLKISNKHGCL